MAPHVEGLILNNGPHISMTHTNRLVEVCLGWTPYDKNNNSNLFVRSWPSIVLCQRWTFFQIPSRPSISETIDQTAHDSWGCSIFLFFFYFTAHEPCFMAGSLAFKYQWSGSSSSGPTADQLPSLYFLYRKSPVQMICSCLSFPSKQTSKTPVLESTKPCRWDSFPLPFLLIVLILEQDRTKYQPPFSAISYSVYCCRDCCLFFFIVVVMFGFLFYLFILCSWWNLVKGFFDPFLVSLDSWWNLFKGGCLTHLFWVLDGIC